MYMAHTDNQRYSFTNQRYSFTQYGGAIFFVGIFMFRREDDIFFLQTKGDTD